jgi:hypothetical protein
MTYAIIISRLDGQLQAESSRTGAMQIRVSRQGFDWAYEQAALGGFASVEEYLEALLRREWYQADPERIVREIAADNSEEPSTVPSARITETRRRLDELLNDGLDSGPAKPMTRDDWAALRGRVESNLGGDS